VIQEWRSPLASSAPVLPLAGSIWTAVMTNLSCIEPGNFLFPQSSASPSSFPNTSGWVASFLCSKQQWASFFSQIWERSLHPPWQTPKKATL
jgi:hypothetical protein